MFVLGTAGHIDHGKSVLVHALTGIDPDRLQEEKDRGMTIDLGFAWLRLPSGQEVGIVDVPGHERFIKNMLAGVGGIDLALLVVAANEGVMPQTKEHLAILDLIEVEKGIVVITKKDLVDDEWLDLVKAEVEELIAPTSLSKAPLIAVSGVTGEGLKELVIAIDDLLGSVETRRDINRPRLPVDRVFTITGSGTIITGTLIDGSLTVGQEVEIVPPGLKSRLRGLQTHKAKLNAVMPGSRVAANLVGITPVQIKRGDVLASPGWLKATMLLTVQLRVLPYLRRPLPHNATVSFHTGAAETMAKVRLLEKDEVPPGDTTWAQLVLREPVAMVKGDRFIIRSTTDTVGGGEIVETHPRRYRRFRTATIERLQVRKRGTAEEIIMAVVDSKQPLEITGLLAQSELQAGEIKPALESLIQHGALLKLGRGEHSLLMTTSGWKIMADKAGAMLREYHQRFPARIGIPRAELSSRLKVGSYAAAILQKMVDGGEAIEEGTVLRLPAHHIQLTQAQQSKIDAFMQSLKQSPFSPAGDLIPEPELINLLIDQRKVVKVSDEVVFSQAAYNEMLERVTSHLKSEGKVTVAEVRDMFKTSRKYALAFLEYMDRLRVTRRVGDERVLCQKS